MPLRPSLMSRSHEKLSSPQNFFAWGSTECVSAPATATAAAGRSNSGGGRSRKMQLEREIVKQRDLQFRNEETWRENSRYFQRRAIESAKYEDWSSEQYARASQEALSRLQESERRSADLECRRRKLKELLRLEAEEHKSQMEKLKSDARQERRANLQSANLTIKWIKEDEQRKTEELKKYQQWIAENPGVREGRSIQMSANSRRAWDEALERKRKERELREREASEERRRLQSEREECEREERRREEERRTKMSLWRSQLDEQVERLRSIEAEKKRIEAEQSYDLIVNDDLKSALSKSDLARSDRLKEYQHQHKLLRHQHKLRLREKTKQVQEEIEQEREVIEGLVADALKREEADQRVREWLNKEMVLINDLLRKQKEIEKIREKEIEFIWQEEARKLELKREEQWKEERQQREKLLRETVEGLQEQILGRMRKRDEELEELDRARKTSLLAIERRKADLRAEEELVKQDKLAFSKDLDLQVAEKDVEFYDNKLKELGQQRREKQAEVDSLRSQIKQFQLRDTSGRINSFL